MNLLLTPIEARVLGVLIEKERTTPDHYPLTLNSLTNACNQKSSRSPVMDLDESEVETAVSSLREKKIVWEFHGAGSRTPKYKHDLTKTIEFSKKEIASVCVLLLRGAQTTGEIRNNSTRIYKFIDLNEVDDTLNGLQEREDGPFITKLSRQQGHKEQRFVHCFCGEINEEEIIFETVKQDTLEQRVSDLEEEVKELKHQLKVLNNEE